MDEESRINILRESIMQIVQDEEEKDRKAAGQPAQQATEQQERIQLNCQVNAAGEFEIACITAGVGNGWEFRPEVLKESLSLWNDAQCFLDHSWFGHSLKDLAGVIYSPAWDEGIQGITAKLRPAGPSKVLLQELGAEMLSQEHKPDVGFSADILFTAQGKKVEKILRVFSVDLVFDPARGGAFLRALNSRIKELGMAEEVKLNNSGGQPGPAALEKDAEAIRQLLDIQKQQQTLADEAEKVRAIRVQMCEYLLTSGLAAAKLPAAVSERVRKQFAGMVFEPTELSQAIEDARALVSELTGGMIVNGPGAIHGMYSSGDQLQAAVDDLLGAERDEDKKNLKVASLQGIRELYLTLTGDLNMHGGYHPEHVKLATTADFTGLVKNALNKIVVQKWTELGRAGYDWWRSIVVTEHFNNLNTITGTLVGTVGALPTVAEGAEYTELAVGDSPETADFVKYGGYIPLTLELIDRDETRKLRAYPAELASAGLRKLSALVAAIFTDGNNYGPTMADTGTLFNATAVTTKGGHKNYLTTALSASEWEIVSQAVYKQPMLIKQATGLYGTGPAMALSPRYCLVPRALKVTAMKILYPAWENTSGIHSENMQQGAIGDVLVVPEWTDVTDWAAAVDPRLAPAIFVGERFGLMPEIFIAGNEMDPAVFMNDESRLKVRHFLAVWVNDFRPLHRSVVAG